MDVLATAVKKLRSTLGLTQPAFAERIGISVRAVANYEKDRDPSGEVLQRLANVAARHNLSDLAQTFVDAFSKEVHGRTTPGTTEEKAWVQATLLLLRNRDALPGWKHLSTEFVAALEALVEMAARKPSLKTNRVRFEEALIELRYHAAPNAEQKIQELARTRAREAGESFEQAYAQTVHERPDLYEDYLEDRAAAAKGTSLESSMSRGRKRK